MRGMVLELFYDQKYPFSPICTIFAWFLQSTLTLHLHTHTHTLFGADRF